MHAQALSVLMALHIAMLMGWFLDSEDQESLAVEVYQMWLYRSMLLGLSFDHTSVPLQPEGYVPSNDTLDAVAPSPQSSVLLGLSPYHTSVPIQPEDYVPSDATLDAVATSPYLYFDARPWICICIPSWFCYRMMPP
jgi:hypothetical protein